MFINKCISGYAWLAGIMFVKINTELGTWSIGFSM